MYEEGRKLYTAEINAAVRGAKRAGADEIVVVDCHGAGGDWSFNSLIPEMLDADCTWVAHHPWSRYTELLEQAQMLAYWWGCTRETILRTAFYVIRSPRSSGTTFGSTMIWSARWV